MTKKVSAATNIRPLTTIPPRALVVRRTKAAERRSPVCIAASGRRWLGNKKASGVAARLHTATTRSGACQPCTVITTPTMGRMISPVMAQLNSMMPRIRPRRSNGTCSLMAACMLGMNAADARPSSIIGGTALAKPLAVLSQTSPPACTRSATASRLRAPRRSVYAPNSGLRKIIDERSDISSPPCASEMPSPRLISGRNG